MLVLINWSCEKDDTDPSEIKFKLNGVEHILTGQSERGMLYTNNEFIGEYVLEIEDNNYGVIQIAMDIWRFEEIEKKYLISTISRSFNPRIKIDDVWYRGEDTGVGSIEITDFSGNRIKGIFNFEAKNEALVIVSITDGTFDLPYSPE